MATKKPSLKEFSKMCEAKLGNVTEIAKGFFCERRTVYNWMQNPKWKDAYDEARESLLDFAESQQLKMIKGLMRLDEQGNFKGWIEKPSETLIIWFEKTRGKHRGLTEKTEVDHTTKGESLNKRLENMTDEELQQKILELSAKMK